ncbi:MAG: MCE family protein [Calditrichaeota bacterium]|nr:MCE family protein [Calditrichota bacterium]MCB9391534.1 MCE family protein [Calditrichota bacterium]
MKQEIRVGAALLASLIILISGIIWGKGYQLRASRYVFSVDFKNAGGLEKGANVMANGVIKGRVKDIEFRDGFVRVTADLDDEVKIYSDYFATIESPTVMAGQALSIYTGTTPPFANISVPLNGTDPQGVGAMIGKLQDFSARLESTLSRLDSVLVDVHVVLGDTGNQASLKSVMSNAAGVTEQSNELLRENRKVLEASLEDLRATLASARELSEKLNGRSDSTLAGVDSAMASLTAAGEQVRVLIGRINAGEGTVGKLFTQDDLYIKLQESLTEIDSLSHHLRTKGMRQKIVLF